MDQLTEAMKSLCGHVTHAFYASYVHSADFSQLRTYNVPLFKNFLVAIDNVAGNSLERVVVHTGGKVSAAFPGLFLCGC